MKKIIVAGFFRTGSTLQYNIIRCTLQEAGKTVYGCFIDDYDPTNPAEYHVIKTHEYNEELFRDATVFATIREHDDVLQSIERVGIDIDVEAAIKKYVAEIMPHVNRYWHYYDMKRSVWYYVLSILARFNLPQSWTLVALIESKILSLKPPTTGNFGDYDKTTLLHPNHIAKSCRKSCKNCKCK